MPGLQAEVRWYRQFDPAAVLVWCVAIPLLDVATFVLIWKLVR